MLNIIIFSFTFFSAKSTGIPEEWVAGKVVFGDKIPAVGVFGSG